MPEGKLSQDGTGNIIVKFPAWQLVGAAAAATTVIAGVWLSNRDLGFVVGNLSRTVSELKLAVDELKHRPVPEWVNEGISALKINNEKLERRVERLEMSVYDARNRNSGG